MDNVILNSYSKIPNLNVSRETCNDLEQLISMIQEKNKEINIISKKTDEKSCDPSPGKARGSLGEGSGKARGRLKAEPGPP